ncbi:cation:dicarboxylase symporter family transporter [Pigmentibacter sp. JX0631]|uniref:dicarboxylate/amino acid:cation symporter n=1 Tax=Pigmentibacter sp. JX0631 TaxID=2976982 RepID=UPI002468A04D|nr:cation:dicarboxylase symporter family transporter [Pigmentibacter sp. JX0631]WGL59450.1 cation:dicarboxylase symporter family transporter [Pigmentibacter sp. JX0631]
MIEKFKNIMLNHWTILITMILGVSFGLYFPFQAKNLSFIGEIYLELLQISVIPIMMTAIICGFFNIFHNSDSIYYLKKLSFYYFIFILLTCFFTFSYSLIISPGHNLSKETLELLSNGIANSEKTLSKNINTNGSFIELFKNALPINIVKAIYERKDISILLFSILLGICLGRAENPNVTTAIKFFDAIFSAFMKMVNILLYVLPIGIFFLISGFISSVGLETLKSLFDLIALIYVTILTLFIIFLIIISRKQKISIIKTINNLKSAYLIAFATSSSFASMPAAMLSLTNEFKLEKKNVELILPLGISIFKPGIMIRSISIAFFLMNLYKIPINFNSLFILLITSFLSSIASTAGPAILSATTFGVVLSPLGIPPAVGIFLLLSIEPLIDPITSMLNIQSNCMVTVLVSKNK